MPRLGDEEPVERITVMQRKVRDGEARVGFSPVRGSIQREVAAEAATASLPWTPFPLFAGSASARGADLQDFLDSRD